MAENGEVKNITGARTFFRKRVVCVEEAHKLEHVQENGSHTNPVTETFTEELNSPLSETQTTKSPWKEPPDVEDKKECPRRLESCRAKIENYYTSFKSFLAKNDLSYFIEMSSRVFFPLTYMAFIAYFFGKYGI